MKKPQFNQYLKWLLIVIMCLETHLINAQVFGNIPQNSKMTIFGTSNVHDWDMDVTKMDSELSLTNSKTISTLIVKIPVTSIKSGKDIMDTKTYEAFNFKTNPTIIFQLTEVSSSKLPNNEEELSLIGNLTCNGETRKISFKSISKTTSNGEINLKGNVSLKMTDFKMKPPTAMLGAMKTGNAVTIKFDVTYKRK